ncbi:TlpA family protein disulfide reductase [Luteolibacter marinus]|uniref:TlpA family protein disulfide reductase n=1 Tax=Luteolibacter marinus TaxID=2776705 RepID=UPI001867D268|nr:TlpA disulfide reductase family protein [Luteolibacter marinus]
MKTRFGLLSALLMTLPVPLFAQKTGEAVTTATFGKLDWIQGEAPAEWEPGKVYLLECWATWCGPCVAAIPHVDELYDRYRQKGLRVCGINVWEDGRDMVAAFVKKKGDGMSYPVAYTGKGGAFETEWLKPAGVTGIPSAFVVKDGRVLLRTHPSRLTGEVIEAFLEGGDAQEKALGSMLEADRLQAQSREVSLELHKAMRDKDKERIGAKLAELEAIDPKSPSLPPVRVMALVACGDWEAADQAYAAVADERTRQTVAYNLFMFPGRTDGMPADLKEKLAADYELAVARTPGNYGWIRLAGIRWELGQKDKAMAAAQEAAKKAEAEAGGKGQYTAAVCRKLIASLEEGTMPDAETLGGWAAEKSGD